jgi:hypothetical protein
MSWPTVGAKKRTTPAPAITTPCTIAGTSSGIEMRASAAPVDPGVELLDDALRRMTVTSHQFADIVKRDDAATTLSAGSPVRMP